MAGRGGLSRSRLARLSAGLRGHVERGAIAGAVALLWRRGEVHAEAVGAQHLATGAPMRRDTIFRVASLTKPITAVAAMILVEEGRLRLDDPVDAWLPELRDRRVLCALEGALADTVPAARPITPRDLLTFRAGLGATMAPPGTYPIQRAMAEAELAPGPNPPALPPDEMMRRLGALPLMHQPGERWMYHTAYDILGVLIARVARQPLEAFLAERVFAPLGMEDTTFAVPEAKRGRLAGCYQAGDGGALVASGEARDAVEPSGSTGLFSTADDYLAFGRMMLGLGRLGERRILARPTIELMTTDQITREQKAVSPFFPGFWDSSSWGFGVSMVTRRDGIGATPGSYGWVGGFGTAWSSDPREEMVAILMIQRLWDPVVAAIHEDFRTLAYQAIAD